MKTDKIAQKLADILPNRPIVPGMSNPDTSKLVEQEATRIKAKQDAKELARIKYIEKQKFQAKRIVEQQKRVEAIEALEAQTVEPLKATELAERHNSGKGSYSSAIRSALQLQGASRPEITKLLTSLNINLSVQLTKQDTANLLACLLTCNHSQLQALMANKKVPVVIKTVIKRLIEDEKLGNIETIEKLWDRIFGKGPMQLSLPEGQQLQTGIIPNVPVSREAYIVIRDTLMK